MLIDPGRQPIGHLPRRRGMAASTSLRARRTGSVAALVLAAAVALAGCGTATSSSGSSGSTGSTAQPTGPSSSSSPVSSGPVPSPPHLPTAIPPSKYVERVVVRRSGGVAGKTVELAFTAEQRPAGYSRAQGNAVLKAAADPRLRQQRSVASPSCWDHFVYRVSITYADHTTHSFAATVVDATSAPVRHLLTLAFRS